MKKIIVLLAIIVLVFPVVGFAFQPGLYHVNPSTIGWVDEILWALFTGVDIGVIWVQCPGMYYPMLQQAVISGEPLTIGIDANFGLVGMFLERRMP